MKIRAVTSFFDPSVLAEGEVHKVADCSRAVTSALQAAGYKVQSQRVATPPFPSWLKDTERTGWPDRIHQVVNLTKRLGWQYTSIGPAVPTELDTYDLIPSLLSMDETLFSAGIISDGHQLYPQAAAASARVIVNNSKITPDGFTNLRFAALANVEPYAPFLPAAYALPEGQPAMALAIECADEAVQAFEHADGMENARKNLLSRLEKNAGQIEAICSNICQNHGVAFKGFDFSPAPYPEDLCSLGKAMELLGVPKLGMNGSLTSAAFLASTLDKGNWKRVGFNGLMLPVLEDSILAKRAADGFLTVKDLLLYSAVCGTGLDTIPLARDTTADQLAAILMDLAALAVRLHKPLTGRFMPIPGKQAGDPTDFNFEFFANSRVMELSAEKLGAPMTDAPVIEIFPRKPFRD